MRLYYYSGATLPSSSAHSVHVMKMCRAFADQGHEVVLFGKEGGGDAFAHYGVAENFKLALAQAPRIRILGGLARLMAIPKFAREVGAPDLVYGRDPLALALYTPNHVPFVLESHHLPFSLADKIAVAALFKRSNFAGLVVISEALKADILAAYPHLNEDQILVAHDGADMVTAKPLKLVGDFKAGYAGSLHPGKGAEMIVGLAAQCPDIDFHIVGGDEKQVAKLSASAPANLHLHGHQPHEKLPSYLAACDVLLAPYQSRVMIRAGHDIARWMSPLKIFEYMAAGKPMIASDLPVINEVLKDGKTALLVAPEDVRGWAEALTKIRNEIELAKALADNAHKELKKHYTWDARAQALLKFIG